jgi:hypothetical protein
MRGEGIGAERLASLPSAQPHLTWPHGAVRAWDVFRSAE